MLRCTIVDLTECLENAIMELIAAKRLQKEQLKLKKQQADCKHELTRLAKLLPDDLYRTVARQSKNKR